MKLLDAVEQVLVDAKTPLHIAAITANVLQRGLWQSKGKTPQKTLDAQIAVDIKTL